MYLDSLLEEVDYSHIKGDVHIFVTDIVYDSRKVSKNSLFICIQGAISDGHDYIKDAIQRGAIAIIIDKDLDIDDDLTVIKVASSRKALAYISAKYFDYPAKKMVVIGITGTKGKTTIAYMIREVLEKSGYKTGLIGTIETIIGEDIKPSNNTTPESYIIQETFSKMVKAACKYVVMEVSSQGLKYNRVDGIMFDYGIFTNLSVDHIGKNEHSDFNDYLKAKSLLFKRSKVGIVNIDDKYIDEILKESKCKTITYAIEKQADFTAKDIRLFKEESSLGLSYKLVGKLTQEIKMHIPGRFSVYNSLAAIALLNELKIPKEKINRLLFDVKVKGRIELLNVSKDYILLIDYAHNAMSLESLLTTLKEYKPKRLVCVFGCGGNRARDRRYQMGEVSSRLADLTVITSDNPRFENPQDIINDIKVGVKKSNGEFIEIIDRKEAIKYCIDNAIAGDLIVLAGKGHETYQEIKGIKYPMDEREIIACILKNEYT